MKQAKKIDLWIDRSIAQLMKRTDDIDSTDSHESVSEINEVPVFQAILPHAEASDYLSINEWMEAMEYRAE
jgi:hypothetical protein